MLPTPLPSQSRMDQRWHKFTEILQRLHQEGIYIHSEQLAEFLLAHGLPVDLCYVPEHLHSKAIPINQNYQGDMVSLAEQPEPDWDYSWMNEVQTPIVKNNPCYKI
ncbi:MAG: hypothetical protein RIB93_24100 [Coleofasciculus sp. D1-CHI-01]|uniref:hypothetical protein n=1 Tax=Coleofasciculus sp. D1-CHI-01 TaxID=3068482 RepID=UPI0032FF6CB6